MIRDGLETKTVPWKLPRGGGRVLIGGSTVVEIESDGPVRVRVTTGKTTGVKFDDPRPPSSPAVIPLPVRRREDPRRKAA